jgi:hypothetical protein
VPTHATHINKGTEMPDLTDEEWGLLGQLSTGEQRISSGAPRHGADRLVELGLATSQAVNMSDIVYAITDAGRAALSSR